MSPKKVLLIGSMTLSCGGFLIFHGLDALPLWIVWTVGPLCWYLGSAVMLVGSVVWLQHYLNGAEAKVAERPRVVTLQFKKLLPSYVAPAGVIREIPSMGGFVY